MSVAHTLFLADAVQFLQTSALCTLAQNGDFGCPIFYINLIILFSYINAPTYSWKLKVEKRCSASCSGCFLYHLIALVLKFAGVSALVVI
jgi:hypothetical protein